MAVSTNGNGTLMILPDKQETMRERWNNISSDYRLLGLMVVFSLLHCLAILLRPENPVIANIVGRTGIEPEFLAWLLMVQTLIMVPIYYLTRRMRWVSLAMFPWMLILGFMALQVAQSATAPIFHLINGVYVWLLFVVLMYLVLQNRALFEKILIVQRENRQLKQMLKEQTEKPTQEDTPAA